MSQKTIQEWKEALQVNVETGLSEAEAKSRQAEQGENALKEKKKTPLFIKFLCEFKDALIIILLFAAVISLLIEPEEWFESAIIFAVVILNAVLGVFQENKAEKSLEALKKMSQPNCKVLRDGIIQNLATKDLVVGDVVLLEAGDIVPSDGRILTCSQIKVDESALTGESLAVEKIASELDKESTSLGDQKNCLFSSTYITNGRATMLVTHIGMQTEIGKIASSLLSTEQTLTPLQKKLEQVGKTIGILAIAICILVFFMEWLSGLSPLDAFKTAVALAVAAIPEGLATVVTIVLAIGVKKMSKQNAIVKKLPAVETLGSTSVVCSDKTGTLTQNRMTVVAVYQEQLTILDANSDITEKERDLLLYFATCCDASITSKEGKEERIGDPTELALLDIARKFPSQKQFTSRVFDLPFDSERKRMTVVHQVDGGYFAITKGAPDLLLALCSLSEKESLKKAREQNDWMAQHAYRVLALGLQRFDHFPKEQELETALEFLGLVGMIDPARLEVKDALRCAKNANIQTVMITGDHVLTATAIAKELGILEDGKKAITSQELEAISDEELAQHIDEYRVFARVAPKDKVRIVEAWQKNDAIVAMTGDGVNDAPALKKADIGCAMGITGTEVSKQAADMILTDDNFATIISAVKQGRGIFANIQKCVKYLLSSNIGEVITIFLASFLSIVTPWNFGVPLLPIHLLWINLVTDSLPAFGLAMEEPSDDVMQQKPRPKKESFFANHLGRHIALEGLMIGGLTLAAYLIGYWLEGRHALGQTMAFFTLAMCQLFHAFNIKSEASFFHRSTFNNRFLTMAFVIGFVLQLAVLYLPFVNTMFQVEPLSILNFSICMGLAFCTVIGMEVSKAIRRHLTKKHAR